MQGLIVVDVLFRMVVMKVWLFVAIDGEGVQSSGCNDDAVEVASCDGLGEDRDGGKLGRSDCVTCCILNWWSFPGYPIGGRSWLARSAKRRSRWNTICRRNVNG